MSEDRFDRPVLLMRLGEAPENFTPTLGQAIDHVMQQPSDERGFFDIVTETGLITHRRMNEIAASDAYLIWANQGR